MASRWWLWGEGIEQGVLSVHLGDGAGGRDALLDGVAPVACDWWGGVVAMVVVGRGRHVASG